jgi:hypothetical protein
MTPASPAEPAPRALGESLAALAAQIADLRGQIHAISERLDEAGLSADMNLAARFEDLAQTVADALEAAAPRGPAAPYWIGLDRDTYATRLADLRQWADTVLRQHYGGCELRDCWAATSTPSGNCRPWPPNGIAPTAAAAPDLARALEFSDRWLPGTMRRITDITRACMPQCAMLRGPGAWAALPRYRQ